MIRKDGHSVVDQSSKARQNSMLFWRICKTGLILSAGCNIYDGLDNKNLSKANWSII